VQARSQYGALPVSALLHDGLRSAHRVRLGTVPRRLCPRAHRADVQREKHDGRVRPAAQALLTVAAVFRGKIAMKEVEEQDAERAEQELGVLCLVNPKQCADGTL
jgi:hypothetical protein